MNAEDLKQLVQLRTADLTQEYPGIRLHTSSNLTDTVVRAQGYITVHSIIVPESERGEGIGTKVMQSLCELADEHGLQVAVTADMSLGARSKKALVSFYKDLGFVANTGSKRDFAIMEGMRREPAELTPDLHPMDEVWAAEAAIENPEAATLEP